MTIETITMPQLGESVTEGTISRWLVSPGDQVKKYDPIAEVMTDKVNAEIPSSFTGIIKQLIAAEDETLSVGEAICEIEVDGGSGKGAAPSAPIRNAAPEAEKKAGKPDMTSAGRYSPAVLRLSQENGIDLSLIQGTGAGGRITRKDILNIVENGQPVVSPVKEIQEPERNTDVERSSRKSVEKVPAASSNDTEIPVTAIRKTIAANMLKSKRDIPHAWMMVEVDASNLVKLREAEKVRFKEREGYPLTYFAFFMKAVSQALKEFPQINSMWAGDKIIQKKDINLNIAVAAGDSLFVPVVKHADEKTIKGLAREISELAEKARNGKLKQEDMQGGTFTVNNTGSFGSIESMGIINHPQAAILQVESIVKKPVIVDGMIAIRDCVNLCLSLDHRILDGLVCGRFLSRVKEIVENMNADNTSIY